MEGAHSEIVGEAASCSVVVYKRARVDWCGDSTIQVTEGRPDQCEQEQ